MEQGWPTASDSVSAQTNGPSRADVASLQIYLDTNICDSNSKGTEYLCVLPARLLSRASIARG